MRVIRNLKVLEDVKGFWRKTLVFNILGVCDRFAGLVRLANRKLKKHEQDISE
jgi:hypothetical protein